MPDKYRRFPQAPTDRPIKDLTGQRFGGLLALRPYSQRTEDGSIAWICRCDYCGIEVAVSSKSLRRGEITSCGCRRGKRQKT